MKRQLLFLALMLIPLFALADAVEIDGIYYNLIEKTKEAEVTSNPNKYSGYISIPDKVTYNEVEYKVTYIGESAFLDCSGLTSISLPNGLFSIGDGAFQDCNSLVSVPIPNSVSKIGNGAFSGCGVTSVNIPSNVTVINDNTFSYCKSLTTVTIPNSVTSIGGEAFSGCI